MTKEEALPYINLLSSVIHQSILDNDMEFLKSELCNKFCQLLGINQESMIKWIENPNKDSKFYPEFYLKWNFSGNYKQCSKCLNVKYCRSFTSNAPTGEGLERTLASVCNSCKSDWYREYYAKKRA